MPGHQEDEGPQSPVYETVQESSTSSGAADCAWGKRGSVWGTRYVVGSRRERGLISEWGSLISVGVHLCDYTAVAVVVPSETSTHNNENNGSTIIVCRDLSAGHALHCMS